MTKDEIIIATERIFSVLSTYCSGINETAFFDKPGAKWSVAENVQHLIIATSTSTLAFSLPRFVVRLVSGRPNRRSRAYSELVAKYKMKLQEGGAAGGRFIPKPLSLKYGKEKIIHNWMHASSKYLSSLKKYHDHDLDGYLVKHPLLGKITLRELCYFTIYHTEHHLNNLSSIFAIDERKITIA